MGPCFVYPDVCPVSRDDLACMLNKLCGFLNLLQWCHQVSFTMHRRHNSFVFMWGWHQPNRNPWVLVLRMFQQIHSFIITEADALWITGDHVIQQAYVSFCDNPSHLVDLSSFQFIETKLWHKLLLKQVLVALSDMLHAHQYIPRVTVYYVGKSDFSSTPQHLIRHKACANSQPLVEPWLQLQILFAKGTWGSFCHLCCHTCGIWARTTSKWQGRQGPSSMGH